LAPGQQLLDLRDGLEPDASRDHAAVAVEQQPGAVRS
jgi:hypothetical protein